MNTDSGLSLVITGDPHSLMSDLQKRLSKPQMKSYFDTY